MEHRDANISSELGACGGNDNAALDTTEAQAQSNDRNVSLVSNVPTSSTEANSTPQSIPFPAVDDSEIRRLEPLKEIIDKLAIGERVPPQISMRYELLRFCTLRNFPRENKPFITRIAQAGFYYSNCSDEVVCYCCGKRKRNWLETDIPLDVHYQLSPNCRFIKKNHEVNVPTTKLLKLPSNNKSTSGLSAASNSAVEASQTIDSSRQMEGNKINSLVTSFNNQINISTPQKTSTAVSQPTVQVTSQPSTALSQPTAQVTSLARPIISDDVVSSNNPSRHSMSQPYVRTVATSAQNTGVLKDTKMNCKHPSYATEDEREASFRSCSAPVVEVKTLVEAGFFYAGFGDCCRCFHCGVGLRHWQATDDPWIEHSRWSKTCAFVKEKKGEEFVHLVQLAIEYQEKQHNQELHQQNQEQQEQNRERQQQNTKGIEKQRDQKTLKEENKQLKQQSICTQCKQNEISIVFLPCGHLVTCENCAPNIRYCSENNCNKYIKGTVKVYIV